MEIGFLGGTGTVTGSKFLINDDNRTRVLIDCGLFQGLKELRLMNWANFPFSAHEIDAVILTHSHLDHSGALPLLVKSGFRGTIFCSEPTKRLTSIILLDSAKIQEEDAEYANKKGFSKHHPALPLYSTADVEDTLPLIKTVRFHEEFKVGKLIFKLYNSGHILGASSVLVKDQTTSIYFSGDLGRNNDPLMWPPEPPPEADYIVMESTYGDREHTKLNSKEVLRSCINEVYDQKGVLLIPSFAVGRSQNLIYEICNLKRAGEVPSIPLFFNSPMGSEVSSAYEAFPTFHRLGSEVFSKCISEMTTIKTSEDSQKLNKKEGPMAIIAASGMLTGGRVLHHLKAFAGDPKNMILLAGFQSPGTRGWSLANGSQELKVHGSYIDIKCKIITSDAFSAHADRRELLHWLRSSENKPKKVFLVHGESSALDSLRLGIQDHIGYEVLIPKRNQYIELG